MRQPTYRCSQGIALVGPCTGPLGSPLGRHNRIPGHRIRVTSLRPCCNRLLGQLSTMLAAASRAVARNTRQSVIHAVVIRTWRISSPGIRLRDGRRRHRGRPRPGSMPAERQVRALPGRAGPRRRHPPRRCEPAAAAAAGPPPPRAGRRLRRFAEFRDAIVWPAIPVPAINAAPLAGSRASRALSCIVRAISRCAVVSVWSLLCRHSGWRNGSQQAYRGGCGAAVARSSSAASPGGTRAVSLVPSSPWFTVSTSPSW